MYHPPMINWDKLAYELDISDFSNEHLDEDIRNMIPESVVHEISHAYDCIGTKAFDRVGNEKEVFNLIDEKYNDENDKNESEVRVSAITFLVLQPFGFANLSNILESMSDNLNHSWFSIHPGDESDLMFLSFIYDEDIKKTAKIIRNFILKFEIK